MTNNRNPLWRETATDSELHDHVTRMVDTLRQSLYNAENTPNGRVNVSHTRVVLDALERSHDELILRADDRGQMDATRPEKPEPPVRDCLTDLFEQIAAEVAAEDNPAIVLSTN